MDYLTDTAADMAEEVIDLLQLDKIRECISLLSSEEQKLIHQHYYDEISEISQPEQEQRLRRNSKLQNR